MPSRWPPDRRRRAAKGCLLALGLLVVGLPATPPLAQERGREARIDIAVAPGARAQQVVVTFENPTRQAVTGIEVSVLSTPAWADGVSLSPMAIERLDADERVDVAISFDVKAGAADLDPGPIRVGFSIAGEGAALDTRTLALVPTVQADDDGGNEEEVAGGEAAGSAGEGPVLRLVEVRPPTVQANEAVTVDFDAVRAGYDVTRRREFQGAVFLTRQSTGFTALPASIVLGEPFTFVASQRVQIDRESSGCRKQAGNDIAAWGEGDVGLALSLEQNRHTRVTAKRIDEHPVPCRGEGGGGTYPAYRAGGTLSVSVRCRPRAAAEDDDANADAPRRFTYRCAADGDGEVDIRSPVIALRGNLELILNSMTVYYAADAEPSGAIAWEHPFEEADAIGEDEATTESGVATAVDPGREREDLDGTSVDDAGSGVAAEGRAAVDAASPVDPGPAVDEDTSHAPVGPVPAAAGESPLDPGSPVVAALISAWISIAEPPSNATRGDRYRYEPWGRVIGTSVDGGVITVNARPEDAEGQSSPRYLWQQRETLDSVDHCTLGEYVEARLAGNGIDHCRGRYGPEAPDLAGMTSDTAAERLGALRLKADMRDGDPAPAPELSMRVQRQSVEPGTPMERGESVTVWIHSAYADAVAVPDVVGMTREQAGAALGAARLGIVAIPGSYTDDPVEAGTVESQMPPAAADADPGANVFVTIFRYTDGAPPLADYAGMPAEAARANIMQAGFAPAVEPGDPAPSPDLAGLVQFTLPPAGTRLEPGAPVTVVVYAEPMAGVRVPDLAGQSRDEAVAAIERAGLRAEVSSAGEAASPGDVGRVASQSPPAGAGADAGASVALRVWEAPRPVVPPEPEFVPPPDAGSAGTGGPAPPTAVGRWQGSGVINIAVADETMQAPFDVSFRIDASGAAAGTLQAGGQKLDIEGSFAGNRVTLQGEQTSVDDDGVVTRVTVTVSGDFAGDRLSGTAVYEMPEMGCVAAAIGSAVGEAVAPIGGDEEDDEPTVCPTASYDGPWSGARQ